VADEVERALDPVAPSQKRGHLDTLADHFPDWQSSTAEAPPPPALSAAELVEQLLRRVAELSAEDRARLAGELQPEINAARTGTHHLELWKKLGIDGARPPADERNWRLLAVLVEFYTALDQLAWTLWRNFGVKSAFWKESDLNKLAGPYLAGDTEVSSEQVRQTVERTRRLIAAILGAPGRAAADVAGQHASQFSPEAIEVAARPKKGALESLDAVSWREYKQRHAAGGTAPHLEAAVQAALARAAEDLIGGRVR